jgi:hypothetical protein
MSAVERGCSLDDCSLAVRETAACSANHAHPTTVRRPTPEEEQTNLVLFRRSLKAMTRRLQIVHGTVLKGRGL